jgi:hypothetical protein
VELQEEGIQMRSISRINWYVEADCNGVIVGHDFSHDKSPEEPGLTSHGKATLFCHSERSEESLFELKFKT